MDHGAAIYLNATVAWCPECARTELARIVARESGVFLERVCPVNGSQRIKIVSDYRWYLERQGPPQTIIEPAWDGQGAHGCPQDCGLCAFHTAGIHLPVFSITNDCNLNCPICFTYNRPDHKYYKSVAEVQQIITHLIERAGNLELINLTGGEPTRHPQLFEIIAACQHPRIGRITLNTNGLRIAMEPGFAERLKAAGVQLVLSLDTLEPEKSRIIHGQDITVLKQKALAILEELNIPTTLLPVCIKGVNETDVVDIVHHYLKKEFVHSITIQNMTFTGHNGSVFQPRAHITIDEVEQLLATRGEMTPADFFPLGSYHPLCYSVAYYLVLQDRLISLSKLVDRTLLTRFSQDSYLLNAAPDFSTAFREGLNTLWAAGEDAGILKQLRQFITELYPSNQPLTAQERRTRTEKRIKMVYIHPHMDADNFDIDRVSRCGDIVPDESGRMIPACAYNLLYRQQDPRFWIT
jgi:7,8-dihydro-6-hydroxymethylpterin dimethyltransferase